jgi:RNA polymerase sigma factor (TIGR02999 family)
MSIDVPQSLKPLEPGELRSAEELLPQVYAELRRLAAQKLSHEPPGQTLQATALVHEAWLRLVGVENQKWEGQRHFFGAAAEAMRRILIENARRKQRQKRSGAWERVDMDHIELAEPPPADDFLALRSPD